MDPSGAFSKRVQPEIISQSSEQELGEKEKKAIKDKIYQACIESKWGNVFELYMKHKFLHEYAVTEYGDTALHIAISYYQPDRDDSIHHLTCIKKMIGSIREEYRQHILQQNNGKGNTPLHLAAELGIVPIIECLVRYPEDPLMWVTNSKGETPLFVAVRHGKLQAFLYLHERCQNEKREGPIELCRKSEDGDTILHTAISCQYFELAFQIIHYYPPLVNSCNVKGFTPLHVLSRMPQVFIRGSQHRFMDRIIYYCIHVEELELLKYIAAGVKEDSCRKFNWNLPENYKTLVDLLELLWYGTRKVLDYIKETSSWIKSKDTTEVTTENQDILILPGSPDTTGVTNENQDIQILVEYSTAEGQRNDKWFPANYTMFINFLKCQMKIVLAVLGNVLERIKKIEERKRQRTWGVQIMKLLVDKEQRYNFLNSTGEKPKVTDIYVRLIRLQIEAPPRAPPVTDETDTISISSIDEEKKGNPMSELTKGKETPLLAASKMGIVDMVKRILKNSPIAIQDTDSDEKNSLLLAAEHRQTEVYKWLLGKKYPPYVYYQVDKHGNNAVHLAAMYQQLEVWRIPGSALQLQGERKWYKYVKHSLRQYGVLNNNEGQTPRQIFRQTHGTLLKDGTEWLVKTANSCSFVAALIATVAFATAATIPGGANDSGHPHLENQPAFDVFSISSLVSLCFSVTSLVFFLAILTSRCQYGDFEKDLPIKLHVGLTSLFASITAILVTFCAAHFFILEDKFKKAAFLIYGVTCIPVVLFACNQLPLYVDLISSYRELPLRGYTEFYAYSSLASSSDQKKKGKEKGD